MITQGNGHGGMLHIGNDREAAGRGSQGSWSDSLQPQPRYIEGVLS